MSGPSSRRRPGRTPGPADLDAELKRITAMNIESLRALWREARGREPPAALSKDLIARALAHWLQEERLGRLEPRLRRLLDSVARKGSEPRRHLKVGSVILREYQGKLHDVLVIPGGFCWQGQVYSSLSTIARKITGTSWNGPRFFGLRGGAGEKALSEAAGASPASASQAKPSLPRGQAAAGAAVAVRRPKGDSPAAASRIDDRE